MGIFCARVWYPNCPKKYLQKIIITLTSDNNQNVMNTFRSINFRWNSESDMITFLFKVRKKSFINWWSFCVAYSLSYHICSTTESTKYQIRVRLEIYFNLKLILNYLSLLSSNIIIMIHFIKSVGNKKKQSRPNAWYLSILTV